MHKNHLVMFGKRSSFGLQHLVLGALSQQVTQSCLGKCNRFTWHSPRWKNSYRSLKKHPCLVVIKVLETHRWLAKTQLVLVFVGLKQWCTAWQVSRRGVTSSIIPSILLCMTKSAPILCHFRKADIIYMKCTNATWFAGICNAHISLWQQGEL